MSLSNLQTLDHIITHEEAMDRGLLEVLSSVSIRPSCGLSYFVSQVPAAEPDVCECYLTLRSSLFQNWESKECPDNERCTKMRWLQNMRKHFHLESSDDVWIWFDFFSVPQENRRNQKLAIASLCVYAGLCSRFIPLVRDATEWKHLYAEQLPLIGYDGSEGDDDDDDEIKSQYIPGAYQRCEFTAHPSGSFL